jgi:very-short-patch-repair endonuclease
MIRVLVDHNMEGHAILLWGVLEDELWTALKAHHISTERQEFTTVGNANFAPDFTIHCGKGKLAIETDGDAWHTNPTRAASDTERDNALKTAGWDLLRFSTKHIREQLHTYCLPTITKAISTMGGIDDSGLVTRHIDLSAPKGSYQLRLFDDRPKE